jgi:hypothetical protein
MCLKKEKHDKRAHFQVKNSESEVAYSVRYVTRSAGAAEANGRERVALGEQARRPR